MVGNHAYNLLYKEVMILRNEKRMYQSKLQNIEQNKIPHLQECINEFKHALNVLSKKNMRLKNKNESLEFKLLLNKINMTKIAYVKNLTRKVSKKHSNSDVSHAKPISKTSIFKLTEIEDIDACNHSNDGKAKSNDTVINKSDVEISTVLSDIMTSIPSNSSLASSSMFSPTMNNKNISDVKLKYYGLRTTKLPTPIYKYNYPTVLQSPLLIYPHKYYSTSNNPSIGIQTEVFFTYKKELMNLITLYQHQTTHIEYYTKLISYLEMKLLEYRKEIKHNNCIHQQQKRNQAVIRLHQIGIKALLYQNAITESNDIRTLNAISIMTNTDMTTQMIDQQHEWMDMHQQDCDSHRVQMNIILEQYQQHIIHSMETLYVDIALASTNNGNKIRESNDTKNASNKLSISLHNNQRYLHSRYFDDFHTYISKCRTAINQLLTDKNYYQHKVSAIHEFID